MSDGKESARDAESGLPDPVVADLRASDYRRHALARLAEAGGPVPIADLARQVAATERGESPAAVPEEAVDSARHDLFQRHLPKLTETGVVDYDSHMGTVELATDDERLFAESGG